MYKSTQAKLERRKQARRRRLVVNCICIALIGTATWFISASVAETNKANEVAQQLQAVNEEKDPHKALMAYNYGEAGARSHWNRGTYTSSYSREVAGKQEQILNKGI